MPNWAEGNIRLRGNWENIVEFLKDELVYVANDRTTWDTVEFKPTIEVTEYGEVILHKPQDMLDRENELTCIALYVQNTRRNFIEGFTNPYIDTKSESTVFFIGTFRAAWGVDPAPYLEKAGKHGVDIKIIAYERGMEFKQVIEISRAGEILQDEEIQYKNWEWEAEWPVMGG